MAKVKLGNVAPGSITLSRGSFLILDTPHGPVAQKWPRKRRAKSSAYQAYKESEFGIIARKASMPEPISRQTSENLAQGSNEVWRDFEMRCSFGTLYDIRFDDGTPVSYYRMVAPNSQLVLDQITTTEGAMLYRDDTGWWYVPPGSNGQVLSMTDKVPVWIDPPSNGGGGGGLPTLWQGVDFNASSTTTWGVTQGVSLPLSAAQKVTGVAVYCRTASPTTKLTPCMYQNTTNVPGARVALGPQVTGVVQGINFLPFSAPYTVPLTTVYSIGCAIDVAGFAQMSSNGTIASWNIPTTPPPATAPAISNGFIISWLKCWPYVV